jgi:hypothetical protein
MLEGINNLTDWVHSVPTHKAFQASQTEYLVMLLSRLSLPLQLVMNEADAPVCGVRVANGVCGFPYCGGILNGAHWHSQCTGCSAWPRHNSMRDIMGKAWKCAGDAVVYELGGLYADSQARPADIFLGPEPGGSLDRAIDFVCADPRSTEAIFQFNADKQELAAAGVQERVKTDQHKKRMKDQGLGLLNFEVVPLAFESSGAWGKPFQKCWKEIKAKFKENGCEYFSGNMPKTWSAFTPYQWFPQCASFAVAKHTAALVIQGLKSSSVNGRLLRGHS